MDSRQQPPKRKTLQWELAQEQRQQPILNGPSVACSQPDSKSNPQEDLETQDWVCEPQAYRRPGSRWNISIEERRRLAVLYAQERTSMEMAQSGDLLGVCHTGQQTVSSLPTCPDPTPPCQAPEMAVPLQDLRQMVAELVSEGVERDVLLPHPLNST